MPIHVSVAAITRGPVMHTEAATRRAWIVLGGIHLLALRELLKDDAAAS
jgi:hypothetical protein